MDNRKCPPITKADIDRSVEEVQASLMEKARFVESVGAIAIAADVSKAISLIDISFTARAAGDGGSADNALSHARALLFALIYDDEKYKEEPPCPAT